MFRHGRSTIDLKIYIQKQLLDKYYETRGNIVLL